MKDYKHLHRQNPYQLPHENDKEEIVLSIGSVLATFALVLLVIFHLI